MPSRTTPDLPDTSAPRDEEPPPDSQSARRTVLTLVVAALLGAGVWFLIGQAASYSKLLHAITRAHPGWLVAAVCGALIGYVGYALLYRAIARLADGPRPALWLTLRLTVAIFGASVIATAAGRLGSEYWSLRRMGEPAPQAWSRVLAINTAGWGVLALLAFTGAIVLLATGGHAPLGVKIAWLVALPAGLLPAIWLTSGWRLRLSEDSGGRVRRTLAAALRGVLLLRWLCRRPPDLTRGFAGALLHWGGELLTMWAALRAFGIHLDYGPLVVGYATGYASTILPLPAGGAGGVDAATTYALTLVGVPLGPALLATLVQRLCTYWMPLLIALVAARSIKRLRGDLTGVPPTSPATA